MATLQLRNGSYRVLFVYRGQRKTFTIGEVEPKEAALIEANVDRLLLRIKQKLIFVPHGMDIVDFLRHDGRPPEQQAKNVPAIDLEKFKKQYLDTHRHGAMEANSLATVEIHLNHFSRTLGKNFPMQELRLGDLQSHITKRSKKNYRGHPLSAATLRKEVASLRAAWNWAALNGMVVGSFPSKGLVFPKADEKPPFMTMQEIQKRLEGNADQPHILDCLYLTIDDLAKLLAFVKKNAGHAWIFPMIAFAAHTGARRSEILRVLVDDVDLKAATVLIREKKRSRKQRTTRRVPMSSFLVGVLKKWLAVHPGGQFLFAQCTEVARSKKRSPTTGHQSEGERSSTLAGRLATVLDRPATAVGAITKDEAHDHLKRTFAGSKWAIIPGWHCFRHSFISACASKGIDQRLIDEWTGHSTEEQRRRYRHLYPTTQHEAIKTVFG